MKAVAVECIGIGLAYGSNQVLQDITLAIEPGEFFALLGPSGSGKSTLLRLIAGFNQANRGRLLVDGRDISRVPPHARNIGMVFQSYALWPHMSVYDNVAFGLVERRVARGEIKRRVGEALSLVGLTDYARRRPNQLSGGQQQRVALARTIVIEPQVLLLDEPLSNLDKKLREQMRLELKRLQRTLGITTIFVTHDQEEAMTTADRMAVLDAGVLQQIGRPRELFDTPSNRFVAEFVGSTNLIAGHYDASSQRLRHRRPGRYSADRRLRRQCTVDPPTRVDDCCAARRARHLVRRRSSGERIPRRVHALSSASRPSAADGRCTTSVSHTDLRQRRSRAGCDRSGGSASTRVTYLPDFLVGYISVFIHTLAANPRWNKCSAGR